MNKTKLLVYLLCAVVGLGGIGYGLMTIRAQQAAERRYQEVQEQVVVSTPAPAPAQETAPPEREFVSPVDFEALWEINSDVYAWITVPGTKVDYPILQHHWLDDYYLDHTLEDASGHPGAIYTQCRTARDFSDFNTVIYGHNMIDGAMFHTLESYRDPAFLEEHREVYIYTPTETRTYKIFAAVVYTDVLIPSVYDTELGTDRDAFIESLSQVRNLNNIIREDVTIGPEDKIITLSTCTNGDPAHRYLIEAVLEDVQS